MVDVPTHRVDRCVRSVRNGPHCVKSTVLLSRVGQDDVDVHALPVAVLCRKHTGAGELIVYEFCLSHHLGDRVSCTQPDLSPASDYSERLIRHCSA